MAERTGWQPASSRYFFTVFAGAFGRRISTLTVASAGMRVADRLGVMGGLRAAEGWVGRRLVTGT